jgi:hypothetical protein
MWGRSFDHQGSKLNSQMRGLPVALACLLAILWMPLLARSDVPSADLNHGFRRLYDLDFGGAQKDFETWEKVNPENPMGPASEAAGILFSEFNRLGMLEAQFYEDDSIFVDRKKYEADGAQKQRFEQSLGRAETLARAKLSHDPRDRDALLAMTMASGLRSDFAELKTTAEHGQLLAPFARILLSIAYVREKDTAHAREMLLGLQREFPANSLLEKELARLDKTASR